MQPNQVRLSLSMPTMGQQMIVTLEAPSYGRPACESLGCSAGYI